MKGQFHGRKTPFNLGRAALKAYRDIRNMSAAEAKLEADAVAIDAVTDILTYAKRQGWDVDKIRK